MSNDKHTSGPMNGISLAPAQAVEGTDVRPATGMPAYDASIETKSDEVLISLFQTGEERAFRVLVHRHQERIRNLVYSILREEGVVDDLAQEVFIRVFEALPRFRFESSFYTWVYRIAVNKCRDELRKKKIRRWFSLQGLLEGSDRELQARMVVEPHDREIQDIVTAGLRRLPEKYRLPVVLKDIDGLSYEEMAGVLGCELGTVKSRLFRGRAMLKKILAPLLEEGP